MRSQLPSPLSAGARVALVAPAGPLGDSRALDRAQANVHALGWEPVVGDHALRRYGYLAGTDDERLDDLNRAIRDPAIQGIWCVRGGYGVLRILEEVDFEALARKPKALIGFSDITGLHAAVGRRSGLVTFHGPFPNRQLSQFSRLSLQRAVASGDNPAGVAPDAEELVPGRVRGRLAGGNLALIAALAGTSYFPELDGAILVLEDVNEPVYRIDRMLRQLQLTGALSRISGLLLGAFTELGDKGETLPLEQVLRDTAERAGVPCLSGVPVGHIADQWTLPLGAMAELDTASRCLTIELKRT